MMSQSRKFLQDLMMRLSKSPIVYNATNAIENASDRAQVKLNNIQQVAAEKCNTIVKQVNGTMIIQDLDGKPLQKRAPVPQRLVNWWNWYQQLTGIEDVEIAKQYVIDVQDKLFKCQEERRDLNNQASLIAEKMKEIYNDLIQTKREDPKYVQLTIMENKGLQEQSRISAQLRLLENAERDHFTQLATAIKEYHDSQSMNAQKYKYLSILASATLAILSLCGSMVYNNRRIRDVRTVITEGQEKSKQMFEDNFGSLEQKITAYHNVMLSQNINTVPSQPPQTEQPYRIALEAMESDTMFTGRNILTALAGTILFYCFICVTNR